MKVEGGCYCGAIAYEAEVDPETVGICHCTDCQELTGSPYRVSVPAPAATFKFLRGEPNTFIKTAESGNKRRHAFCGNCGSPIYAAAPENPTAYTLRVGGIRQRATLPPKRMIWCRSALPWAMNVENLPKIEKA